MKVMSMCHWWWAAAGRLFRATWCAVTRMIILFAVRNVAEWHIDHVYSCHSGFGDRQWNPALPHWSNATAALSHRVAHQSGQYKEHMERFRCVRSVLSSATVVLCNAHMAVDGIVLIHYYLLLHLIHAFVLARCWYCCVFTLHICIKFDFPFEGHTSVDSSKNWF